MTKYVHTYLANNETRATWSDFREWHGRPHVLLKSYLLRKDGSLFEVPAIVAEQVRHAS